jgi:hypothetical protein
MQYFFSLLYIYICKVHAICLVYAKFWPWLQLKSFKMYEIIEQNFFHSNKLSISADRMLCPMDNLFNDTDNFFFREEKNCQLSVVRLSNKTPICCLTQRYRLSLDRFLIIILVFGRKSQVWYFFVLFKSNKIKKDIFYEIFYEKCHVQ